MMTRITLTDVARSLGLSTTTVSRALAGYPDVAEETRERVIAAVEALGYVPNRQAQLLRRRRAGAVGLVLPGTNTSWNDPLLSEFLISVGHTLADLEVDLIVVSSSDKIEQKTYQRLVSGRHVDGFLLVRTRRDDWRLHFLSEAGVPTVAFGRTDMTAPVPFVSLDDKAAMVAMVSHLVSLGHSRIGFIGAPDHLLLQMDRLAGYKEGLEYLNLPYERTLIETGDLSYAGGYRAAQSLLKQDDPPTAIICANDSTALGAMSAVQTKGLVVGKDIAITGFDDIVMAQYAYPALTTVRQPIERIGSMLIEMLMQLLAGKTIEQAHKILAPSLIIRESCGSKPEGKTLSATMSVPGRER